MLDCAALMPGDGSLERSVCSEAGTYFARRYLLVGRTLKCVLLVWLDKYSEDFHELPDFPCLTLLESFAREVIPDSDLAAKAQQRLETFRKESSSNDGEVPHVVAFGHHLSHACILYSDRTRHF